MKDNKNTIKISDELKKAFDRWDELYVSGGKDPFWSDGCNLNLVRNHIIHYKRELEALIGNQDYPSIYHKETPQEVPRDYMARSEEIRTNAQKSAKLYKADENYQFLLSQVGKLRSKDVKETCIQNVIGYAKGLEQAIASDDLISMRRHESPEGYIKSIYECAEKVSLMSLKELEKDSLTYMVSVDPKEVQEVGG